MGIELGFVASFVGTTLLGSAALATITVSVISGAIVGAVVGAAVGGLTALVTGGDIGQGILNGAVGGAVSGAAFGLASGVWSAVTTPATTVGAGATSGGETAISEGLSQGTTVSELGLQSAENYSVGAGDAIGTLDSAAYSVPEVASVGVESGSGSLLNAPKVETTGFLSGTSDMTKQVALQGVSGLATGLMDSSEDIADKNLAAQVAMNDENNRMYLERIREEGLETRKNYWEQDAVRQSNNDRRSDAYKRTTIGV